MGGKADLHLHTTYSDGALSTREVVERARRAGLTTISITDHDHTGAIEEATDVGKQLGVKVVSGVELSASVDGKDIHILGYFFNPTNNQLLEHLSYFRAERLKRAERIVEKLHALNLPLPFEVVLDQAGAGAVGRPHIANALLEQGLTGTYHEAFLKYLGDGKPAFEPKSLLSPREAIALIGSAGGLSFVAHPGNSIDERLLLALINEGVDGIEVIHPSHSTERVAHYSGIVSEYFLLASGGSDFHGGKKNDSEALGKFHIPEDHVEMMRRHLG